MTHTTKFGLKSLLEYFRINTMSVAPLSINSFSTFFPLSSNTILPVKSLIAIIFGCLLFFLGGGACRNALNEMVFWASFTYYT